MSEHIVDTAEALIRKAMPGEWSVAYKDGVRYVIGYETRIVGEIFQADDAEFIAWCRTGVPALIAQIRSLESRAALDPQETP
ncbi:hypothetical protein [Rhodococcus sp. IEGM 1330]|uniref:hypothetical protein n=1 Tax=Rhodococcus sp. IEGM 1330 TaxID=3082225 RepID=UPI0029537506|nr:hypothetical protein [Rhodococcus sp. IEGM 1330]MDV8022298.1 hypothetical protein [Rhodococcus sp. IEGM 1330]